MPYISWILHVFCFMLLYVVVDNRNLVELQHEQLVLTCVHCILSSLCFLFHYSFIHVLHKYCLFSQ